MENEAKKIAKAQIRESQIYADYYEGTIEKKDFEKQEKDIKNILKNKNGFEEIYKDYMYVSENKSNRYFMYTNAWSGLFNQMEFDYFLFLVVFLLANNVYAYEHKYDMENMLSTTKNGHKSLVFYKMMLMMGIIGIVCFLSFLSNYLFFDIKYGLVNGEFPMQSIEYFGESSKNLTLKEVYIAICSIKGIGYILYGIVIMFLSTVVKKYVVTALLSSSLILFPYIGMTESHRYYIQPLGFMLGKGFFRGTQVKNIGLTEMKIVTFTEIPSQNMILLFAVSLSIAIFMIGYINKKNRNVWCIKRGKKGILFLLVFLLAGCGDIDIDESEIAYNTKMRSEGTTEKNMYYYDLREQALCFEDKRTGESEKLIREPLYEHISVENAIFCNNGSIYYAERKMEFIPGRNKDNAFKVGYLPSTFSIHKIDEVTFQKEIVFEVNIGENRRLPLGNSRNKWKFLRLIDAFFLDDENIYIVRSEGIYIINQKTKSQQLLSSIPTNYNVAFDGENIYYVGEKLVLHTYNIDRKKHMPIQEVITSDFRLYKNHIEYKNMLDKENVYKYDIKTGEIAK